VLQLAGDLCKPRLGLPPAVYDRLANELDAIYHCAAWVNGKPASSPVAFAFASPKLA
jgi:thioester reductase-like protein